MTPRHVLNMCDVSNIWHVPIMLEAQGAHESICNILQLGGHDTMDLTGGTPESQQHLKCAHHGYSGNYSMWLDALSNSY